MAQITQRQLSVSPHTLPVGAPTLIPGLSATLQLSATTIMINYRGVVYNGNAAAQNIVIQVRIDGVSLGSATGGQVDQTIDPGYYATVERTWYKNLGAGPHTIEVRAGSSGASVSMNYTDGYLTIWDTGL